MAVNLNNTNDVINNCKAMLKEINMYNGWLGKLEDLNKGKLRDRIQKEGSLYKLVDPSGGLEVSVIYLASNMNDAKIKWLKYYENKKNEYKLKIEGRVNAINRDLEDNNLNSDCLI